MNKQLLIEYIPFNLSPQMLKESLDTNRGRLIVRGVIQRANVKNGNGRIYPKEILEREIEKYKNTFIKEQSSGYERKIVTTIRFADRVALSG